MKKRVISIVVVLCIMLTLLPTVRADAAATSGQCGDNVYWEFDEDTGTLTMSGEGDMWDWPWSSDVPWYEFRSSISKIEIGDGVTSIGDFAFRDFSGLTGISMGERLASIGMYAFAICCSLCNVSIPDSVDSIGEYAFLCCDSLSSVYFYGDAPSVHSVISSDLYYNYQSFPETSVLYYIPGTTGWTDSEYYDAEAGTWNGYTLRGWLGDDVSYSYDESGDKLTVSGLPVGTSVIIVAYRDTQMIGAQMLTSVDGSVTATLPEGEDTIKAFFVGQDSYVLGEEKALVLE